MPLTSFLKSLPARLFEIEEELFRDHEVKLAEPELQALVDLALEGAMARKARGEEVTPLMVSALVRLNQAEDRKGVSDNPLHQPDPNAVM